MRKRSMGLGLGALLVTTAALAVPPGPDEIGEFYFYYDQSGSVVGNAWMDCDGKLYEEGVRTDKFDVGHTTCPQH
ncbi:DUF6289 family protein [Luteimonas aquatica]|uniref:DUF6289 family protein n=1 Tax=Luteimonas aquatica TaxID=450364 RepID=UPI001F56652F|nr:DUF6289 family protein [Luteimonas aquatica]